MPEQSLPRGAESQLAKQPNSRDCFICGVSNPFGLALSFYQDHSGQVLAELVVPEQFQGFPGVVHGGVQAALLDEAAYRAAMAQDHNHFFVTAKMTVRYRKPVPVGVPLRLVGSLVEDRGRISTARAELRLEDGEVGAEADATLVEYPDLEIDSQQMEALGWKVYPD